MVLGRGFGQKMLNMFAADLAASRPVDQQSWARRTIDNRFKEWMARIWERLL